MHFSESQYLQGHNNKPQNEADDGVSQERIPKKDRMLAAVLSAERERLETSLATNSYEDSQEALLQAENLVTWRERARTSRFRDFYTLCESATAVAHAAISPEERTRLQKELSNHLMQNVNVFTPRVADIYQALLAELFGDKYEPRFDQTMQHLEKMREDGVVYTLLHNPDVDYTVKHNNISKRLEGYLKGVRYVDHQEGHRDALEELPPEIQQERKKHLENAPTTPPPDSNESQPGVDAMDRLKEGERSPALWSITPPWGGYYKQKTFSQWDSARNTWKEERYTYSDVQSAPLLENETQKKYNITTTATIRRGQWTALPVPYTHAFHAVECAAQYHVKQDQNGDLVVLVEGDGAPVDVSIQLAYVGKREISGEPHVPEMPSTFTQETNDKIAETGSLYTDHHARAEALSAYVKSRVKYLAPKDDAESAHYNTLYRTHENGFAGAVDVLREADCDTANTYFAALCARLRIPVRHVTGHSVNGKNKEIGASEINIGTGHGWSEIWDGQTWVRIDATPPGDPNLEEESDEEGDDPIPGDFGENDAGEGGESKKWSDEEIEALREQLAAHTEELSYTPEERELAEGAGIELKEAREIVGDIAKAERTELPDGERIKDVLMALFEQIVQSRKTRYRKNKGPITAEQGGEEIMDEYIVDHALAVAGGEFDPQTRERPVVKEKEEQMFNGLDLYFAGDKTVSTMRKINVETDETVRDLQRRSAYLVFSALHDFQKRLESVNVTNISNNTMGLTTRTQGISYSGNENVEEDKAFGSTFSATDKVKMWHSLGEGEAGAGAHAALEKIYQEISEDQENRATSGKAEEKRLRLVVLCTDGEFFDSETTHVHDMIKKITAVDGAVVLGVGLTEDAKNIPVIFNMENAYGAYTETVDDLPRIIGKHLAQQAVRLFPERDRQKSLYAIQSILKRFEKNGEEG